MAGDSITKDGSHCKRLIASLTLGAAILAASTTGCAAEPWTPDRDLRVPDPAREFRGVWIATVYNIDWPSSGKLSPAEQRAELIALLDLAGSINLNAVVLQVRSMADAFYDSPIEPWSAFLTGRSGQAPSPYWDPLAFAIEEAHRRGLELHAWFNPFRAGVSGVREVAEDHITRTHPELVRQAGTTRWLDPTSEQVRERALDVIVDVVRRYDVDGVHIDDYFFPYPSSGGGANFDDNDSWQAYLAAGGTMDRADWRREQVNSFVRQFYQRVKEAKRWVKVGISPFGIWRPGIPAGTEAQLDAYDHIYADSRKWLNEGWIDYFTPQLYWKTESPQCFDLLHQWWREQNNQQRHLWPGISTARIGRTGVGEGDGRGADEITRQLDITRGSPDQPAVPAAGHVYWSISSLKKNADGIADHLRIESNRSKVLPPASPWLAEQRPSGLPAIEVSIDPAGEAEAAGDLNVTWQPASGTSRDTLDRVRWWCVQTRAGHLWRSSAILPATDFRATLPGHVGDAPVDAIAVRAVDRVGALGPAAALTPATE